VWLRYWGLERDPFDPAHSPYVPLPSHEEALARLIDAIACARPKIAFFAGAGLGKTVVLRKAVAETRHPRRRFALVHSPSSRVQLLGGLADGLGLPFAAGSDDSGVWRSLVRATRAATLEGSHVVFVVDGWEAGLDPAAIRDLTALVEQGSRHGSPVSLIRVGRVESDGDDACWPAIGLERLTRSEAETYVDARGQAAGFRERVFTSRALTRLHAWSEGVPRALDRLAALSLVSGAAQDLEVVSAEVVDAVAQQRLVGVTLAGIAG
jgi:hypothetical protein